MKDTTMVARGLSPAGTRPPVRLLDPPRGPNRVVLDVVRELGRGAAGEVFEAVDPGTGERFVVKRLRADVCGALDLQRFGREASVMSRLRHPNLMPVVHVETDADPPYFVMPFRAGDSLTHLLKQGPLSVLVAMRIALDLSHGLATAHSCGVVHRDVKPSNVLVEPTGRAVLIDFGLSKDLTGQETGGITALGTVLGTPSYMSPEQCRGERVTDRSDVYSLGVTLIEMILGVNPFTGPDLIETLRRHLDLTPRRLDALAPTRVPHELGELIARMVAKEARQRPQVRSVARLLDSLVATAGTGRRAATLTRPVARPIRPLADTGMARARGGPR